jgi:hypothetical protein
LPAQVEVECEVIHTTCVWRCITWDVINNPTPPPGILGCWDAGMPGCWDATWHPGILAFWTDLIRPGEQRRGCWIRRRDIQTICWRVVFCDWAEGLQESQRKICNITLLCHDPLASGPCGARCYRRVRDDLPNPVTLAGLVSAKRIIHRSIMIHNNN